jgi:hypothetical protein
MKISTGENTANARALGSWQGMQLQSHTHVMYTQIAANGYGSMGVSTVDYGGDYYADTLAAGGTETRGPNAAYPPRIHV